MADSAINDLTAATAFALADLIEIEQSGVSKQLTGTLLRDAILSAQADGIAAPIQLIRADVDRTLTSTTTAQKLFGNPTNGRLDLATGVYLFEGVLHLTTMSATSGNAQFGLLGAGSATLGTQLFHAVGVDGNSGTAATQTGSTTYGSNTSAASIVTAGTGTAMAINLRGTFEVTAAGTIVPSIALVTANAAVLKAGSYLSFKRIGDTSLVSIGDWD